MHDIVYLNEKKLCKFQIYIHVYPSGRQERSYSETS